jgi:hypothetical protein
LTRASEAGLAGTCVTATRPGWRADGVDLAITDI